MTELTKLKMDRDTCYMFACAAYGQEFINAHLFEGDEESEETNLILKSFRENFKCITEDVNAEG